MQFTAKQKIIESIYLAIDEFNALVEEPKRLEKSPETVLFGEGSRMDSFGFVSLVVGVEGQIETNFDTTVAVVDERAMARRNSPFQSVNSLADYIAELLDV